jgi:hypothetical protein
VNETDACGLAVGSQPPSGAPIPPGNQSQGPSGPAPKLPTLPSAANPDPEAGSATGGLAGVAGGIDIINGNVENATNQNVLNEKGDAIQDGITQCGMQAVNSRSQGKGCSGCCDIILLLETTTDPLEPVVVKFSLYSATFTPQPCNKLPRFVPPNAEFNKYQSFQDQRRSIGPGLNIGGQEYPLQ